MNPKLPIIIGEPDDWEAYRSVENAESYFEAIDVKDEIYVGYDAEGRLLKIDYEKNVDISLARVSISLAEEEPNHSDELEKIMRSHLDSLKKLGHSIQIDTNSANLNEMLGALLKFSEK
jgi:hypothetical protein